MKTHEDLTRGPVWKHIVRMTPPMAGAMFAMLAFHLADTWFVARLGTDALAAMGFTFPVVMLFQALAMGLGLGTSACVSRAIGSDNADRARTLATYSLLLAFLIALILCSAAWVFLADLFRTLGAGESTLPLTLDYMRPWLLFAPITVLPMIGNNAIRATGDTVRPSIIMVTAALLNALLDPMLIFGFGPIPALGIGGAALATGLSRLVTVWWALWLMHNRNRLFSLEWPTLAGVLSAWREVLRIAVPTAATNVLMPLTAGIVTRMIATYGEQAVAAAAAGQRIERLTFVLPMAMGSVLVPVIGQNWGAGRIERVRSAWVSTNWYSVGYGICFGALAFVAGHHAASLFSSEAHVVSLTTHYLWIMLPVSAMMHVVTHTGFALNAIHRPMHAGLLTIIRLAGLVMPLAWLGSRVMGLYGVFGGIAVAHLLCGALSLVWFPTVLARQGAAGTPNASARSAETRTDRRQSGGVA